MKLKLGRYLVVVSMGGIVQEVHVPKNLKAAQRLAEDRVAELDPENDDIVVWDLVIHDAVYNPFK